MIEPSTQMRDAIVEILRGRCADYRLPIPPEQIRGKLDVSGTPKAPWGISVSVSDNGDAEGTTGRVLLTLNASVTVYTHVDEDPDGSICDSLAGDSVEFLRSALPSLDGWTVDLFSAWSVTDTSSDGVFRTKTLQNTIPIQRS